MTERKSWAFCEGFSVTQEGNAYLDRLQLLKTPLGGLYVHRIHIPDLGRDPHDHPWWFMSWVLSGSYTEKIWDSPRDLLNSRIRERGRFSLGSLRRDQAHKIIDIEGILWTLVLVGPRRGSWGFWTDHGFVNWRSYYHHTGNGYATEDDALWGGR